MALISALAGGLVSTCERLASRYSDGSGGWRGWVSVRIGWICCVKDIIQVSPLEAGDPSPVYQTCVQICFQNREMPRFPFSLSHNWLQKEKSLGLCQVGTTEMSLSQTSFGNIWYTPPITHLHIIQVWAVQMQLHCYGSCHKGCRYEAESLARPYTCKHSSVQLPAIIS